MARSMRASHPNSALRAGSADLLSPCEQGVVGNAVVHPVRLVEQKAEHVGQREAFRDREKGRRRRVLFVWREHASKGEVLELGIARTRHAEGGGQLEGAVGGCRGYWWRWSSDESSLWVVLWMVRLPRWYARCRCRRARDAEAVFEHRLACRDLAEQEGLLESAAAQQAAGSAEQ